MADVQLEDGHTRIANALLEALVRVRMPGRHFNVMLAVIRKTYGFRKAEDLLATSQVAELTEIDERGVRRILDDLVAWNMLARRGGGKGRGHITAWSVQKDFDHWKPGGETRVSTPGISEIKPGAQTRGKPGVEDPLKPGAHAPHKRKKETLKERERPAGATAPKNPNPVGAFIDAYRAHRKVEYGKVSGEEAGKLKRVLDGTGDLYPATLEAFFASKQPSYSVGRFEFVWHDMFGDAQQNAKYLAAKARIESQPEVDLSLLKGVRI